MSCIIRNMTFPEVEIAVYLAYKEGWNPGLADGTAFYNADPNGFFIAEIDSKVVGCISAVKYSQDYGFIGFYVVEEKYRGSTAGTKLGLAALKYLEGCNIGIDGVLDRVQNYERIGFRLAYKNARYEGVGSNYQIDSRIVPISEIERHKIYQYDLNCFPAERQIFIDGWLQMPNISSYVYLIDDIVCGWGAIRSCRKGYKIGPLFADNTMIAEKLYRALASHATDELVYIDIPVINREAIKITEKYNMKKVFETARMYSKSKPDIDINRVFGVTSFELG